MAAVAWNLKDISPPTEAVLFNFASPEDVRQWDVYSDATHGGECDLDPKL